METTERTTTRPNDGEVKERNVVRELNLFVGGKKRREEAKEEAKEVIVVNNNNANDDVGGDALSLGVPSSLSVLLPTSDREVKERLRSLDEPICLFGEGKAERRERLKKILSSSTTTAAAAAAGGGGGGGERRINLAGHGEEGDDEDEDGSNGGEADGNHQRRKKRKETFYTEGSALLTRARMRTVKFSLQCAKERVLTDSSNNDGGLIDARSEEEGKEKKKENEKERRVALFLNRRRKECADLKKSRLAPVSSVVGDSRPLSAVASILFERHDRSHRGLMLASSIKNESNSVEEDFRTESLGVILSGSWTGAVKVWNVRNSVSREKEEEKEERREGMMRDRSNEENISCILAHTIKASEERITGLAFSPLIMATIENEDLPAFASASMDGTCNLFSFSGRKRASLVGHVGRLAKVKYHPSGTSIATAGYDKTIRLWDANTSQEIFCQEAHSRPSYDCTFNDDGSLLFSTGLDAYARMWDLRSGRCLWTMKGHSKGVTSISVDVTNSLCVTGGEDNLVKVWDLRKQVNAYTIPAHSGLVSSVSFEPRRGCWFSSSSFDGTVKLWSALDFSLLSRLEGHEGKVMDCSLGRVASGGGVGGGENRKTSSNSSSSSSDDGGERSGFGGFIASAGYDRTLKIWK
jgi:WD40 repeat protein